MKNQKKSPLFNKFKLENSESSNIMGGLYTAVGSDTNVAGNGGNDVLVDTLDGEGNSTGMDSHKTNIEGTRDAPRIN